MQIFYDENILSVAVQNGENLLDVLRREGIGFSAPCGGQGTCGKCQLTVKDSDGRRLVLACQTLASEEIAVILQSLKPMLIAQNSGLDFAAAARPDSCGETSAPAAASITAAPAMAPTTVPTAAPAASAAPTAPAASATTAQAAAPAATSQTGPDPKLGVAIDLGTTTIVARLVNLKSRQTLASAAQMNPQAVYGADVLNRITAANNGQLEQMGKMVKKAITALIEQLNCAVTSQAERLPKEASGDGSTLLPNNNSVFLPNNSPITIAGNTIMEHILAGLSPASIGVAPFEPLSKFGEAWNLDGIAAPVWLAPCVSGYVGGDITCGMLALGMHNSAKTQLLIDLGTNGELALGSKDGICCCATAAGPVFEGANITMGMSAMPGATSAIKPSANYSGGGDSSDLELEVIGGIDPVGICGTGLIDGIALMLEAGVIDNTGMMLDANSIAMDNQWRSRLARVDEQPAFFISRRHNIYITQADVRNFQLAKSAIFSGILTLLESVGLDLTQIDTVCIAGGLGNSINTRSAALVGLIPKQLQQKTVGVGNTAIEGASTALANAGAQAEVLEIAAKSHYLELSTSPLFNKYFMENIYF